MMLRITHIEGDNYTLKDDNDKCYKLNIGFYNLPCEIVCGSYIYLTSDILNEVNLFNFVITDVESDLKLIINDNVYYLERIYG